MAHFLKKLQKDSSKVKIGVVVNRRVIETVVVVKWSACSPSASTIRVRTLLKHIAFYVKFVFAKDKNKLKEAGVGSFLEKNVIM